MKKEEKQVEIESKILIVLILTKLKILEINLNNDVSKGTNNFDKVALIIKKPVIQPKRIKNLTSPPVVARRKQKVIIDINEK